MSKFKKWAFGFLLIFLFVEIWISFPIQLEKKSSTDKPKTDVKSISLNSSKRIEGVHFVESREGKQDWELFAEVAEERKGNEDWELSKVKILFYSDEGLEFTVVGDSAQIGGAIRNISVNGNVFVKTANNTKLTMNSLEYIAEGRKLQSKTRIQLEGPTDKGQPPFKLVGGKMNCPIDQGGIFISGGVDAKRRLPNGKDIKILSEKVELGTKQKKVQFLEKVQVSVDTIQLESPSATFMYKDDKELLQSILVNGGVRLSDVDKFATAEEIKLDPMLNQYILSGKPRVVQGGDEVIGERIIFIDGGKKVKVENMKIRMEQ